VPCPLQHLAQMSHTPGVGDLIPFIRPLLREPHMPEAGEARPVLQAVRPSGRATQREPVQRRTAARLEIRLIPHAHIVQAGGTRRKAAC